MNFVPFTIISNSFNFINRSWSLIIDTIVFLLSHLPNIGIICWLLNSHVDLGHSSRSYFEIQKACQIQVDQLANKKNYTYKAKPKKERSNSRWPPHVNNWTYKLRYILVAIEGEGFGLWSNSHLFLSKTCSKYRNKSRAKSV